MKRIFITTFVFLFLLPQISFAAVIIPPGCSDSNEGTPCGLAEFGQLFVNVYDTSVGYVGAVALLFFIFGGFIMLASGGRSEWVDWGRRILTAALFGSAIVLLSFMIVRYIELNIFEADTTYIIGSDEQCAGKPDGTRCTRDNQNVYTCIAGQCTTQTQCQYLYPNGEKFCTLRSRCVASTIEEGLCWGDENWVCCEFDTTVIPIEPRL
ncbi:MAG: hypothetical protein ACPGO5_03900 [Patescibacteria group bacterium]